MLLVDGVQDTCVVVEGVALMTTPGAPSRVNEGGPVEAALKDAGVWEHRT